MNLYQIYQINADKTVVLEYIIKNSKFAVQYLSIYSSIMKIKNNIYCVMFFHFVLLVAIKKNTIHTLIKMYLV